MPQKVLRFTGINRKVNEFQNSGACEELINLRPEPSGGLRVVRNKHIKEENVQYDMFYEHAWGSDSNDIISVNGVVSWMNAEKDTPQTVTDKYEGKTVELSSAGNVLVIYCREDNSQSVYRYKNDKYEEYAVAINMIRSTLVDYVGTSAIAGAQIEPESEKPSVSELNASLLDATTRFYAEHPNGLCGAAIIGCAYELEDGTEVWSTAFTIANIARYEKYEKPFWFQSGDYYTAVVCGTHMVYFKIQLSDAEFDGIRKINVYATRPVLQYEYVKDEDSNISLKEIPLSEMNLDGRLMYYQGSLTAEQTSLLLDFGKTQAGERVMEVTSGCVTRVGSSVSYNNRFHYYKSTPNHIIQVPTISQHFSVSNDKQSSVPSNAYPHWIVYVRFEEGWRLIDGIYNISDTLPCDFAYPMAGVKQLAFVKGFYSDSGEFSVPYNEMFYVNLNDSSAYNYSYAFDVTPKIVNTDRFYEEIEADGQLWGDKEADGYDTTVVLKKESNAINVSAPYNPFAFPVKYSYSFGGEIKDIATSYTPISATQVGQYPLTVFTTSGIFSLEQGGGDVLYSNIVPIQPLVITGKATPTPYGTFFISSRSLYMLSGREVANLSYVLNGQRELSIRDTKAYKQICIAEGGIHDLSDIISAVDFEEFIEDAVLVYDQLHNELHIGSISDRTPYSYVLNLDSKSYYKRDSRFLAAQNGARYVIEKGRSNRNVVDLHAEKPVSNKRILLQSRPFSLDAFFTHIQRLIMLTDANLSNLQTLFVSVFASDDLNNWKCVISSQKTNAVLRQIRTNRAAKSYRDYIVVISGYVDSNTDLSDIIADYTVVKRRLG